MVDIHVDLVVEGLIRIATSLLCFHPCALLLRQPNTITVGDLILDTAVHRVVDNLVEVNQALHAALGLRFL